MPNFRQLIKHQTGAVLSTVADFGVMSLLVELAKFQPEVATALGAFCGALTNFTLGRSWIFSAAEGQGTKKARLGSQLARYALVSVVSLACNTLGEVLLNRILGLQYFVARVVVAVVVSLAWNYPMHRWFVFPTSPHTSKGHRFRYQTALWLSVWFGCGYSPKAPGTVGAIGALPLFAVAQLGGPFTVFAVGVLVTIVGIWSSAQVVRVTKDSDPQTIVIDEVAGVLLTWSVAPQGWIGLTAGFVLFRAFDIIKPWPVRKFEDLPGGFGVMMDDVAAAVMAGLVLLALQAAHLL